MNSVSFLFTYFVSFVFKLKTPWIPRSSRGMTFLGACFSVIPAPIFMRVNSGGNPDILLLRCFSTFLRMNPYFFSHSFFRNHSEIIPFCCHSGLSRILLSKKRFPTSGNDLYMINDYRTISYNYLQIPLLFFCMNSIRCFISSVYGRSSCTFLIASFSVRFSLKSILYAFFSSLTIESEKP